ncbi:NHS-like protein 1 isoform X2 [Scleropages formosus]|uniref:NHS-like protein 1 isoform X2 n=1 Tax=Scleropages formosus TaxID=113540 RepID=UPI0010FAC332|nr:NHS-like protein 1 isoform X2 [Scleropages formosus]
MPFVARTVEPRLLCRQPRGSAVPDERAPGSPALFATLDEVWGRALGGLLQQLSDLSRHAADLFSDLEAESRSVWLRSAGLQRRLETLQGSVRSLDPKKVKIPVSNLDEESKWTVHYTAPWHQQENVFLPSSRPACVEDLHRQAKVNLKTALRECDKLRKDGFRSSQYYSQGPTFSSSNVSDGSLHDDDDADKQSTTSSSAEEEKLVYSPSPRTPQPEGGSNATEQSTSSQTKPLPTPEEKMRQQAQAVPTDVIPINITGETFDRQASIRRSLVNSDTIVRRPKKVKRRKTISGVPDNIQKELAKGHHNLRARSMYIPEQHSSTLGRVSSMSSGLRRTDTRDSSCQTEEVKIVQPSMRRIRAQRGQGIAAQMANFSASSSGSISIASDSPGVVFAPQLNGGGGQRFHSLPRQGARISLNAEVGCSSAPYRLEGYSAGTVPRQIGRLQADETVVHLRNSPKTATLSRPKSQEVRSTTDDQAIACVVSPYAAYSTSLISNATLSSSAEIISVCTAKSMQPISYPADKPLSATKVNGLLPAFSFAQMATSSNCDSAVSLSNSGETDSQCSTLDGRKESCNRDAASESSYSDKSFKSQSTVAADQWVFEASENILPKRPLTSSCSTPINHIYSSLERSPNKTDASSLYSMDNDGYYTSMHMDSGLKSRSHNSIHSASQMRHSMYEYRDHHSLDDRSSLYSDKSLSRSISLRKSKKPPLPPTRTDSLRRKPGKKPSIHGSVLNETLIATLQQSLQMTAKCKGGSSPSQSPSSDYEDPWVLRPRSQSSASAGSSGVSASITNVYSLCPVTPSQSDTSSLRSDYAESWGYYGDYPRGHGEQLQSPVTSSPSTVGTPGGLANGGSLPNVSEASLPPNQDNAGVVKPKAVASPDRVHRLTSPSSGYSSQSNTPTAGTPVPSFMRSVSPAGGKTKPKVPERKSSLLSSVSVSSSSTSLSSNTSDSARTPLPPPPPPLPGFPMLPTVSPTPAETPVASHPPAVPSSTPVCTNEEIVPPPPSPPLPAASETVEKVSHYISSPDFPPPPPEVLLDSAFPVISPLIPPHPPTTSLESSIPIPPPPPPLLLSSIVPPPAPALNLKGWTELPRSVNPDFMDSKTKEGRMLTSNHSEESAKSSMPLITAQALQMVQLRSVKKLENEEEPSAKSQETEGDQESIKPTTPEKPEKLEPPSVLPLTLSSSSIVNEKKTQLTPEASVPQVTLAVDLVSDSEALVPQQMYSASPEEILLSPEPNQEQSPYASPTKALQITTPKKKPPISTKKPKLSLIVPSTFSQPASEEKNQVLDADLTTALSPQNEILVSGITESQGGSLKQHERHEEGNDSEASMPSLSKSRESLSSDVSADSLQVDRMPMVGVRELSFSDNNSASDRDASGNGDGGSSTTGSISSKEEEDGEVFEDTNAALLSPVARTDEESVENMVTPTRPRTTEDLFAAIHRSKRKVLGRRESEEERSRGLSPSPPVTPTGSSPGQASLSRQTGSIQRSLRKSATSSDSFKALLLKKGSRSETSFRMSAAEMLKSTDPRFQRTRSESWLDLPAQDTSSASLGRSKRAQEEWARSEGSLTRYSTGSIISSSSSSLTGGKYGRSRAPPSAASSKYNARSRILSSPMTVICEREGELAEAAEAAEERTSEEARSTLSTSPHLPDSSATLCEGGST